MNMLLNRMLPLILLLLICRSAAAEDVFWVLGSFVDENAARVEGNRISNEAGVEVLLFESIVNAKVQYRLLTGALVAPGDQEDLRQQLLKVGISDVWTLRFDDGTPYMETVFSDLGVGEALSSSELAEIDAMLRDFDDEYAQGAGTWVMDMGMSTEDIGDDLVGATAVGIAGNYVIVGSYESAENANDYASKLGNSLPEILSHELTVRRNEVAGETYYRVMVGPVLPSEEADLMEVLSGWGASDAWLLPGVTVPVDNSLKSANQDIRQDIRQPQRGLRIPSQSGRQASGMPLKNDPARIDFNPVLLRKNPPNFPDPRNKH
tara:strand:- start:517 stop:1476 length:960 start_codon:yes stop_codon:yes gene_type:complete